MPATTWLHAALLEPMIKMMRFWAGSGVFMMIPGAESTFLHSKLMMSWTEPDGLSGSFFFLGMWLLRESHSGGQRFRCLAWQQAPHAGAGAAKWHFLRARKHGDTGSAHAAQEWHEEEQPNVGQVCV